MAYSNYDTKCVGLKENVSGPFYPNFNVRLNWLVCPAIRFYDLATLLARANLFELVRRTYTEGNFYQKLMFPIQINEINPFQIFKIFIAKVIFEIGAQRNIIASHELLDLKNQDGKSKWLPSIRLKTSIHQ